MRRLALALALALAGALAGPALAGDYPPVTFQVPIGVPSWPWLRLAQCETGTWTHGQPTFRDPPDWHHSGRFHGGLQFEPGTWESYRWHVRAAHPYQYAWQAPAWVQVRVGMAVSEIEGSYRAWPTCRRILGLR